MRIELKQNRIVIILTEAESHFLVQKMTQAGQKDINNYLKSKLLKALELKGFEDGAMVQSANNFNLAKIKHVSTELKQRQDSPTNYSPKDSEKSLIEDEESISEEDLIDDLLEEELAEKEDAMDTEAENMGTQKNIKLSMPDKGLIDDLLSDLLDQDLLEGRLPGKSDMGTRRDERGSADAEDNDVGARLTEPVFADLVPPPVPSPTVNPTPMDKVKKRPTGESKAPKSRKHSQKPEKNED